MSFRFDLSEFKIVLTDILIINLTLEDIILKVVDILLILHLNSE